jgi:hypothetical protein
MVMVVQMKPVRGMLWAVLELQACDIFMPNIAAGII